MGQIHTLFSRIAGFALKDNRLVIASAHSPRVFEVLRDGSAESICLPILQGIMLNMPVEVRVDSAKAVVISATFEADLPVAEEQLGECLQTVTGILEGIIAEHDYFSVSVTGNGNNSNPVKYRNPSMPTLVSRMIASWASDTPITLSIQENGEIIDAQPAG